MRRCARRPCQAHLWFEAAARTVDLSPLASRQLRRALPCAGTVRHFAFAGLVQVQNGTREAVLMHVYLKSIVKPGKVAFRGVMFAESVERDWYSLLDGYVCQPDVAHEDWPGIFVR